MSEDLSFVRYVRDTHGPTRLITWILGYGIGVSLCLSFFLPVATALGIMILGLVFLGSYVCQFVSVVMQISADRVRNILLYKQITGRDFTPQDQEVLDRYFGTDIKNLIPDVDRAQTYRKITRYLDIGMFIIICVGLAVSTLYSGPVKGVLAQ